MKNLIYQFWSGNMPYYAKVSSKKIKDYASYIGAEYLVNTDKSIKGGNHTEYMNCFLPIHDEKFHDYDNVLFLDMDIFPVDNIEDNIFESENNGIAMAKELGMPEIRYNSSGPISGKADETWAKIVESTYNVTLPRDEKNRLEVYNSGVVLYTKEALIEAKKNFVPISSYQQKMRGLNKFYSLDQNYLHAMLFTGVTGMTELNPKWNSQIYFNGKGNPRPIKDNRTPATQLVHLQLRGRDSLTDEKIHDIVNEPVNKWRHR